MERALCSLADRLWTSYPYSEGKGLTGRLTSAGKTPQHSLGAALYVDTKENPASEFVRVGRGPVRFWLRSRPLPQGWSSEGPGEGAKDVPSPPEEIKETKFLEKDLHPLLVWFARHKLNGVRAKTIEHSVSKKKTFGEWVHPDIVGVRFPMTELDETVTIDFASTVRAPLLRLFSFELKRQVAFANLRESFFQAVSNSSWAHEGYLVAAQWPDDEEFNEELARLTALRGRVDPA